MHEKVLKSETDQSLLCFDFSQAPNFNIITAAFAGSESDSNTSIVLGIQKTLVINEEKLIEFLDFNIYSDEDRILNTKDPELITPFSNLKVHKQQFSSLSSTSLNEIPISTYFLAKMDSLRCYAPHWVAPTPAWLRYTKLVAMERRPITILFSERRVLGNVIKGSILLKADCRGDMQFSYFVQNVTHLFQIEAGWLAFTFNEMIWAQLISTVDERLVLMVRIASLIHENISLPAESF